MTWIPVTERLPKLYINVLVFDSGHVVCAHFDMVFGKPLWIQCDEQDCIGVTHWMPLPEGPKQ